MSRKLTRTKARKPKTAPAKRSAKRAAKFRHKVRAPAQAKAVDDKAELMAELVAANARALGLTLEPAWRGGVAFNLQLILRHAALVEAFVLPDDTEPAPVFHA